MSLFHLRSCHFSFPFPFSVNGRLAVLCERVRAPCDIYFAAIPRFISFLFSFRSLFFFFPTISNRNIYWPLSNISLTDVFSYFPFFLSPILSHSISAYLYPFLVLSISLWFSLNPLINIQHRELTLYLSFSIIFRSYLASSAKKLPFLSRSSADITFADWYFDILSVTVTVIILIRFKQNFSILSTSV